MINPLVFAALILGAAPLAAFADPMSVGGDGILLAAATSAPAAAADGGGAAMTPVDTSDDDAVPEPLTAAEPAAPRSVRRQPDTAHAAAHTPEHAGTPTHKKGETTRWQSLLPGVMK